jgi:hypothetical protein
VPKAPLSVRAAQFSSQHRSVSPPEYLPLTNYQLSSLIPIGSQLLQSSNPNFTTGVAPWTATGGATLATTQVWGWNGGTSLVIEGVSGSSPGAVSELLPVTPGVSYVAPLVLFAPTGWPRVQTYVNWFTSSTQPTGTTLAYPTSLPVSAPVRVTPTATAPPNAAFGQIGIEMLGWTSESLGTVGAYLDPLSYSLQPPASTADWNDFTTSLVATWESITSSILSCRRAYYTLGNIPGSAIQAGLDIDAANGNKVLISLQPQYNPVSQADLDTIAVLLATCTAVGLVADVALWHEPITQGLTSAQYTAMIAYYGPTVRQYYPLVYVQANSDIITSAAAAYYPGDANVDKVAVDYYCAGWRSNQYLDIAQQVADGASTPKPFSLWEVGANPSVDNPQQIMGYAQYVAQFMFNRLLAGKTVGDVCWYSSNSRPTSAAIQADSTDPPAPYAVDLTNQVNAVGISDDNTTPTGFYDLSLSSYSLQQLTLQGYVPGASLPVSGGYFVWPDPGNTTLNPNGYDFLLLSTAPVTIPVSATSGVDSLAFLGSASNAFSSLATSAVIVEYADGSQSFTALSFPDWALGLSAPRSATQVMAKFPYRVQASGGLPVRSPVPTYLYASYVPVDYTKSVVGIQIEPPSYGDIGIFSVAALPTQTVTDSGMQSSLTLVDAFRVIHDQLTSPFGAPVLLVGGTTLGGVS